ncbi:MAG: formate dehydrogenase accessory sulfurtransferase FdhD [Chloroflexota bacterium]
MTGNGTHRSIKSLETLSPVVAHSEPVAYLQWQGDDVDCSSKPVVIETAWPLIVNGEHWLTVLCTPIKLDYFILGFLYNEGLITGFDDVLDLQISQTPAKYPQHEAVIRVELRDRDLHLPQRRTLTSGCGGGVTFVDLVAAREPVCSSLQVTPGQISELMGRLMAVVANDYRRVGGFHTAGLSDGHQLLVVATDIGRHNTLDKVAGECLVRNISMREAVLLTTGRVSVEMMGKAARMQVPLVATLNSPTHLAVELAREWGITLIGYARGTRMHVYTGWQRVCLDRLSAVQSTPVLLSP